MRKTKYAILALLCAVFCLQGCGKNTFYGHSERVYEDGWNMDDDVRFEVEVKDVSRMYNFYIDVRNTLDYQYSNFFLFITTTFPDHAVRVDTLECPLADAYGNWNGRVSGHYADGRYPLHANVIFPQPGTYTFQIAHGMRDTNLVGIKNVGLHIDYAK